jgi:ABC-type antimicrobial peptide transport system permease subunit
MDCLIVGVKFSAMQTTPYTTGVFLNATTEWQAVVGDSVARTIYSPIVVHSGYKTETVNSDALRQRVIINNASFPISGICLDPLNNGNVTYVPLEKLENITQLGGPNMLLISVDASANYAQVLSDIKAAVAATDSQLTVVELSPVISQNINFLDSLWGVILFLPAFALAAAALSLVSYLMLTIAEQHQEFAILRATGAKPRNVIGMLAVQSLTVLLASFGVGTSLGTILCILVLTTHPVVSAFTVGAIAVWLLAALAGMFLVSLYPAIRFARRPLLEIMS